MQNHILFPKETFLFLYGNYLSFLLEKKSDFLEGKNTNSSSSWKKFYFTEGKYTNSACLETNIWFSWRRSYFFPLVKWLHTKDSSLGKKYDLWWSKTYFFPFIKWICILKIQFWGEILIYNEVKHIFSPRPQNYSFFREKNMIYLFSNYFLNIIFLLLW